jgi:hypothetical protein
MFNEFNSLLTIIIITYSTSKVSNETGGTYSARVFAESLTTSRQTRSAVGSRTSKNQHHLRGSGPLAKSHDLIICSIHTVIIHINQRMQSHHAGKLAIIISRAQLTSFVRAHRSKVVLCMMDKTWSSMLFERLVQFDFCSFTDLTSWLLQLSINCKVFACDPA